jgi:hypothetical protein
MYDYVRYVEDKARERGEVMRGVLLSPGRHTVRSASMPLRIARLSLRDRRYATDPWHTTHRAS